MLLRVGPALPRRTYSNDATLLHEQRPVPLPLAPLRAWRRVSPEGLLHALKFDRVGPAHAGKALQVGLVRALRSSQRLWLATVAELPTSSRVPVDAQLARRL